MVEQKFPNPINADPSKFSFVEKAIILKPDNENLDIDKATGERFYRIDSEEKPTYQRLAALILKGVVNVSDIVKIGSNYYSHVQNLDKVNPSEENIAAEMEADAFIINAIVLDNDHRSDEALEVGEDHNLMIDIENKKLNFFDFGATHLEELYEGQDSYGEVKESFRRSIDDKSFGLYSKKKSIFTIIKRKTEILLDLYKESDFENFKSMVKKSGLKPSGIKLNEEEQRRMFKNIRIRAKALNDLATEELEKYK